MPAAPNMHPPDLYQFRVDFQLRPGLLFLLFHGTQRDKLFYLLIIFLPLKYPANAMQLPHPRGPGRLPDKLHLLFSVHL